MYIRQEATKELFQANGSNITFNSDYKNLASRHRPLQGIPNGIYERSTLFPLYYSRQDTINEIEDYYHMRTEASKDFSALSGAEIVHTKTPDEYHIWNHAKGVDLVESGRLRGNMQYKEDKWYVQINPLNLVQKNESQWLNIDGQPTDKIPMELGQNPIPNEVLTDQNGNPKTDIIPVDDRGYTVWKWEESEMLEAKLKDKWMKVRIRYTGNKLAIISAVTTLYSISYS